LPELVILLRAIGPATHKRMTMTQWREAAQRAGFNSPETVINTGNMIAGFTGTARKAGDTMTEVLRSFGLGDNVVPVIRSPALLHRLIKADPIPKAVADHPNRTGVYFFAAAKPDFAWLREHDGPQTVHVVENHLVVDFGRDVAQAGKLIRQIDRNCGTNTSRSWSSLVRLAERCRKRRQG